MAAAPQEIKRPTTRKGWFFPTLRAYNQAWLRPDLIAGVSSAAVIVPAAMAYSSIAGLPPQSGLYTSLIALPVYALLGTSPILSVSVTSTLALLTAGTITRIAPNADPVQYAQIAATLALVTGIVLIIIALLKLGFITNFISEPVLTGAKAGLGLWIASGQLGKVLGIPFTNTDLFNNIKQALTQLSAINPATLGLSILTLIILFGLTRYAPRIPGALVAVAVGILAQLIFNLSDHGVALIHQIQPGLPLPSLPDFSYVGALIPAACALALMSALESIATARLFARPSDSRINPDREMIAVGAVNIGAAFFQGFTTGGGTSQSAVNVRSGARTQVSQLAAAVVVALALTILAPVFNLIPDAVLGAIVLFVVTGLIKLQEIRQLGEISTRDMILGLAAFFAVIVWGMLEGLAVAVLLSMLALIYQSIHPQIVLLGRKPDTNEFRPHNQFPDDELLDGLVILRTEGAIYFGNAGNIEDYILDLVDQTTPPPRVILLDGKAVPDVEYTGLLTIARLERELKELGIELWFASLNPRPLELLQKRLKQTGRTDLHFFVSTQGAVETYLSQMANPPNPPLLTSS